MATFIRIGTALLPRKSITHVNRDTTGLYGRAHKPMLVVHNTVPSQHSFVFGFVACSAFEPYEMLTTRKTKIVFDSFSECDKWFDILQQVVASNVITDREVLLQQLNRKSIEE